MSSEHIQLTAISGYDNMVIVGNNLSRVSSISLLLNLIETGQ